MQRDKFSFTIVELLVAIFLLSIFFLGIFGAYQLSMKIISFSSKKITALYVAQGEIERIKNLPYLSVGTINAQLPYARGILQETENLVLNRVNYLIDRKVKYVYDPSDGAEDCLWDYKKVEIKVIPERSPKAQVRLVTNIYPNDKAEEMSACTLQPGGLLSVNVFNANGQMVSSPLIEIFNPATGERIDVVTPVSGHYDFPLPAGEYRVVVQKSGYSKERTYSKEEVALPKIPNPLVIEGQITPLSLSIDKVSSFLVKTLTPWGFDYFADSFKDESKISLKENVTIENESIILSTSSEGYVASGTLMSVEISPQNLLSWGEFSFSDEEPVGTDIKYQIYYFTNGAWELIPDNILGGNSEGFDESPIDLSPLPTSTFSKIKLKGTLSTQSSNLTPALNQWMVSWKNSSPTPISYVSFNLRGEKMIGQDANENPVYKYDMNHQTNSQGLLQIPNLEWDYYHFSQFVKDSQTLELTSSTPAHPIPLEPDTNLEVDLFLQSQNSLLLLVQDEEELFPIFSATATLSSDGFEMIEYTNEKGQALFIPLPSRSFTLNVSATGYIPTSTTVFISGPTTKTIKLRAAD